MGNRVGLIRGNLRPTMVGTPSNPAQRLAAGKLPFKPKPPRVPSSISLKRPGQ